MSTIVEDAAQNFAVNELGFDRQDYNLAWNAGVLLVILATGNVALAKFFHDVEGPENDSIDAKLNKILAKLNAIGKEIEAGDYNVDYTAIVTGSATRMEQLGSIRTFRNDPDPSPETRVNCVGAAEELEAALITLLKYSKFPFLAMVYSEPELQKGLLVYGKYYVKNGPIWGSWPGWYKFQVYEQINAQQLNTELDKEWSLPELLKTEITLEKRWDGLFSLPFVLYGLPLWLESLMLLEPFYRLTGHWHDKIHEIALAMDNFRVDWENSLLWTREMPSLSKIAQPYYLYGGEVGGGGAGFLGKHFTAGVDPLAYGAGFSKWPCGILDPVMGVEVTNKEWWTSDGPPGFMTEQQRTKFKQLRQLQHLKLLQENGRDDFGLIILSLLTLQRPPAISPSLATHPEHMRVTRPGVLGGRAKSEKVTDPSGKIWPGFAVQSSVTVTAPISVQPNPYAGEGHAARAASNIMFGYEIAVIPVGGIERKTLPIWQWPLSLLTPTALYKDLYHDKDGILHVPYSTTPQKFSMEASTWKTVTDGKRRDQIEVKEHDAITFTVKVDVCDQKPHPKYGTLPLDQSDPEQKLWIRQHGAIWVTIEADKDENKGRSFEVIVEVTEMAAVDAKGRRKGTDAGFTEFKTYTLQMPMPADIYKISVPAGYFDWFKSLLEATFHVKKDMEIPGPTPDHDPVLELAAWRTILEKNPAFLQSYVLELRRITDRPLLMPHQALAELDAAVSKLVGLPPSGMLIQGDDAVTRWAAPQAFK
jgi:hypothetical protein